MPSADTMHDDVMREHPDFLPAVESDVKEMFSTACSMKISPVSRAMRTYMPEQPSTSVYLYEMFPVLRGARIMDIEKEAGMVFPNLKSPLIQIFRVMETKHHGMVMLLVIGYTVTLPRKESQLTLKLNIAPSSFFDLALERPTTEDTSSEICLHLHSNTGSSSKNKQRKATNTVAIASLVTVRMGCSMCGSLGSRKFPSKEEIKQFVRSYTTLVSSDDEDEEVHKQTTTKHLRCSRCWDKLRFPVWYCCRECQIAHYPEHRRLCGKMPK